MLPVEAEKILMETIGFDYDDVLANAEGIIRPQQRTRLAARQRLWSLATVIALLVGVCFTAVALFSNMYGTTFEAKLTPMVVIMILTTIFAISARFKRKQYSADLRNGQVNQLAGSLSFASYNRGGIYTIRIADGWFDVPRKTFKVFKSLGQMSPYYIIYYAPNSKTILSVQTLKRR